MLSRWLVVLSKCYDSDMMFFTTGKYNGIINVNIQIKRLMDIMVLPLFILNTK